MDMIKDNRFPCPNCLTLSICKALFEDYKCSTRLEFVLELVNKCSLLDSYLQLKSIDPYRISPGSVKYVYNFFAKAKGYRYV